MPTFRLSNVALTAIMAGFALAILVHPLMAVGAAIVLAGGVVALMYGNDVRIARYGLCLLAALLPMAGAFRGDNSTIFDMNNSSLVYLTSVSLGKMVGAFCLGYLGLVHVLYRRPLSRSVTGVFIVCFAAVLLLSYAVNPKSFYAVVALRRYLAGFLTFLLVTNLLDSKRDVTLFLGSIVAGYVLSSALSLAGVLPSDLTFDIMASEAAQKARMTGASGDSAVRFGTGLAASALISMYAAAVARERVWRYLAVGVTVVLVFSAILSYSRGVYIGFAIAAAYMLYALRSRVNVVSMALGTVGGTAILFMTIDLPKFLYRLTEILANPATDVSYFRRLSYHIVGFKLFIENPFIGIGPGNFMVQFASETFRGVTDTFNQAGRSLHNMYFAVVCDSGLLGFLFFMLILISAYRMLIAVARQSGKAPDADDVPGLAWMLAVVLGFVLFVAAFNNMQSFKLIWMLLGLCVVLWRIYQRNRDGAAVLPRSDRGTVTTGA